MRHEHSKRRPARPSGEPCERRGGGGDCGGVVIAGIVACIYVVLSAVFVTAVNIVTGGVIPDTWGSILMVAAIMFVIHIVAAGPRTE